MKIDVRPMPIEGRWALHSYYTLCPYAPDGSGRILAAGADLKAGTGEVFILSSDGAILDRFGRQPLDASFYHTGWWQTWSPDGRGVYYQSGTLKQPRIGRRDLTTGADAFIEGDMEGAPPTGEPIFSGLLGMLYASGYGDRRFNPDDAPVPFQVRDRHGIFEFDFTTAQPRLRLSVQQILDQHPHRDRLLASDREVRAHYGDGLTLMAYCVRWSPDGSRFLFYFGNHCVNHVREEPRIGYVMVSDRSMKNIHLAVDLSYGRRGVHWSWQPDNRRLIGYGGRPEDVTQQCLAEVNFDGSDYRWLSDHRSGGHPSVSPTDDNLIVTDEGGPDGRGAVVFIDRPTGREIERVWLPKYLGENEAPGRNARRVCHHPVFNRTGDRVLCNSLPGPSAQLVELMIA